MKTNVIWIDPNVTNIQNRDYTEEFEKLKQEVQIMEVKRENNLALSGPSVNWIFLFVFKSISIAININPIPPIKPSKSGPINIFGVLDIKRSDGE